MSRPYEARAGSYGTDRAAELRRSGLISRLRLATILPGLACLIDACGKSACAAMQRPRDAISNVVGQ